ncbi:MAG TPA: aldo/keto reductase [Roseateles sp.]|nr:aldo/keto reductase [Roseateles sp.]
MELRALGRTGLKVSALGFGAMHLNDERSSEDEAARLLNEVLDLGVNLIDTARGYGLSEERIGRHLAHRRGDFLLSTKVGYGVEGVPDWSYDCIVRGVERALRLLRTEVLDIVHLHSCPLELLQRGEVIRGLQDCQAAGKLRVAAYSGDNAEIDFAIDCGAFGALQTSLSLCDQVNLVSRLPRAQERGIGVIAKRPVAGAVWRMAARPEAFAEGHYWDRWQAMGLAEALPGSDWMAWGLRFTAHAPGVSSAIIGTANPAHFRQNLAAVAAGPLPAEPLALLRGAFQRDGQDWPGLI